MKRKFQTDIEPLPVAKPKTSIIENGRRLCYLCGCEIAEERVEAVPDVISCVSCQTKEEEEKPDSIWKRADEGIKGTREATKKYRKFWR